MSDPRLIDSYFAQSTAMTRELEEVQRREHIYYAILRGLAENPEPAVGDKQETPNGWKASWGEMQPNAELGPTEIKTDYIRIPYSWPGWIERDYEFLPTSETVILGWSVSSRKNNNGHWVKTSAAPGVLGNELRLHLRSGYDRGIDYQINVHHANRALYRFGADGLLTAEDRATFGEAV
jgi:hypothetical protein